MKGLRKTIFFPIFSLFILLIGLSVSEIEAQNKPLTYPEIITALNTKLPNSVFKNKTQLLNFLLTQIRQRKVDKPLTDEREDLLREAGATDELIETIRENPFGAFDTDAPSVPKTVSGGVVNGRAINLVKPPYPPAAKAVRASGAVNVQVTIDEDGNVILASAVSGHNLLRAAAEQAARASKFNPLTISGQKVMMTGVIVYNFSNDNNSTSNSFKNSLGMEFVMIPAGSFMMGSENGESNEKPVHSVTISKSFYMGKTEVTQEQWEKVMGSNPSDLKNCPRCPVDQVSWEDLQNFITELNKKSEGNYRLPTEAEWEYACRAGSTTEYSYGNDEDLLGKYAWFRKNS